MTFFPVAGKHCNFFGVCSDVAENKQFVSGGPVKRNCRVVFSGRQSSLWRCFAAFREADRSLSCWEAKKTHYVILHVPVCFYRNGE
jgi:hypothetical protein